MIKLCLRNQGNFRLFFLLIQRIRGINKQKDKIKINLVKIMVENMIIVKQLKGQ